MSVADKTIENAHNMMSRSTNAAVRRGVAEVLRNARQRAILDEASQKMPAKLQYLLNELQKHD
jgi:hypothetical protein